MLLDQHCTVCDTQPRKLLWAGRILPSCPPAPTLQSCSWVPWYAALWHMLCSTASCLCWLGIHKPDCRELAGGSRCGHNPALCSRQSGVPRWQPAGKLEGELPTNSCVMKETLQKVAENILRVFHLPHETAEFTPKTASSCWETLTALNR